MEKWITVDSNELILENSDYEKYIKRNQQMRLSIKNFNKMYMIRIKLLRCEVFQPFSLFLTHLICFLLSLLDGQTQLRQKRKTAFVEWNKCFDSHLYDGRVIQIIVYNRPESYLAEANYKVNELAAMCGMDGRIETKWVSKKLYHLLCYQQWLMCCVSWYC